MSETTQSGDAHDESEARFDAEVRSHLQRNYAAHLTHGLLGQTGFRLVNAPTFVEAYVHALSGSDLAVGAARAAQSLGMFLSPMLGATLIEHRRRVLPVGFVVGGLMRLQLLGLALAGFFLSDVWALRAIWLLLGLFGFFLGMQGVVFNFLVSKVIPVSQRGRLLGIRNALSGLVAIVVANLGGYWIDRETLGNGYATTFLVAFVMTSLGLAMLGFVKEPASPRVREPSRVGERLRALPQLLRSDRGFTVYFVARAVGVMGRMSLPFYVLHADARFDISGYELGLLTTGFVLAQSLGNLLWGTIADRRGFRAIFLFALALWMASSVALLLAPNLASVVAVMAGLGMGQGGFMMASQNLVLEFGSRENLPLRIAVANTASEAVGVIGPLLGGVLAATVGYPSVFLTALVFQAISWGLVARWVEEPRRRSPRSDG